MTGRVKAPQDIAAGIFFTLLGVVALIIATDYEAGTASRFGPGMVPRMVSWCLILGGLAVTARSFSIAGDRIERWTFQPNFFVLLSILLFGLLIESIGLVFVILLVTFVSRFANNEYRRRWKETAVLAVCLAAIGALGFVKALELPIQLWPG